MQTGDVILISNKGFIAYLIKKVTRSKFSHVEVALTSHSSSELVGAHWSGIRMTPITSIKGQYVCILRHKKWWQIEFNEMYNEYYTDIIKSKIGVKYDFFSLLVQIYYQTFHKWVGRKSNADKKFYCSEFAAYVNGVRNFYELSPQGLYEHPDFEVIYEGIM